MTYAMTDSDRRDARAKIHQAALRLFAERGAGALAVSELAEAAGMARGTIYNNIENPDTLFNDVAAGLSAEMIARTEATMAAIDDPAARLATGLRLFVRRAHEEPHWGRFIVRFALGNSALRDMMDKPPARDIAQGIETSRFKLDPAKLNAMASLLIGALLAAMNAVLSGHQTWRDAGSNAAELFFRAAGVSPAEARRLSHAELSPLASVSSATPRASKGKQK